jgi:hypothetical protein
LASGSGRRILIGDEVTADDIMRETGSVYCYHYAELPRQTNQAMIARYCAITRRHFAPIAKTFDVEANSRWVLRHYLAIKFATAANLLAGSASYAFEQNLLLGVPYFNYYAALNACRTYLLTSPLVVWDGSKTIKMTHQNILNRTADYMRALDPKRRAEWRQQLETLRNRRELFSYHFPLSGPDLAGAEALDPDKGVPLTRMIAELASLNSECLDASLRKHASMDIDVKILPDHEWASIYDRVGVSTQDPNDRYRFGQLVQGWKTVAPLEIMCSDGLMDDVYGAWSHVDGRVGAFDPDTCSGVILSL